MDIQDKTKEEVIKELKELQRENNSLKELLDKENATSNRSENAMRETNLKLTLAMKGGNMAWWEMDVTTGNVTFDKHKVEMLGYSPENFTHYKDFTALVHPNDYKSIMNAMKGHLDGTLDKYEAEYRILASSGEYVWFYDYGSVVKRDSNGAPLICTGFVFNITDKKKAEERILLISRAVESTSDAIGISDSEGRHFYQNKALSDLFGYENAEELKAAGGGMSRVKDPAIAKQMFNNILHGKSWSDELEMVTKSGRVFPAYERADGIKDKDGNIIGIIGIITDITEKQEFEKKILRDKIFADQLINSLPGLFYVISTEGKFVNWNKNLETVSGYSYNEMAEISPFDLFAGEDKLNIKKNIIQVFSEGNASAEAFLISKNQTKIPYYFTGKKITIDDQIFLSGLGIDISTQKTNEEKLLKSENMLQTVLDNFPGVVFWKDRQSNYMGCNQSFATGAGLKSPDEVVGKTDFEMPWASTEAINYLKDDKDVMECGNGRMHIIETQHLSDGQVVWLDTSKFPMLDSSGQVIGVVGVSNNISTLKMAEQELVNTNKELVFQNEEKEKRAAELIIANKELTYQNEEKEKRAAELMIAKDKAEASDRLKTAFINNISHEIRTPLNGILGFAPFIVQPDTTIEEKDEYLEILNFSSNRLMNTITDIMDISLIISGNIKVRPQPIDISSLLTNVFKHFQEPCKKKNLGLKLHFPDNADHFILNTDEEMLRKAVSQLVDNSVKFTKEGNITLGFELINNEIEIFVKDTGTGIEKDSQVRIFENFMQENVANTRGHEGSGLGLSIAKGMIQLLGGKIRLESTKNLGTTVFLTLPNNTSAAYSKSKNLTKAIKVVGKPIILIAEDDDSSYFYLETLLKKDNKTLRACNGQEAVDLCRMHPDINLVLMDIKMPEMNGIEATQIIKSFRNNLPIVAVTAFAQSDDKFKIKDSGCDDYLSKPINKAELLSLIQKYFKKK